MHKFSGLLFFTLLTLTTVSAQLNDSPNFYVNSFTVLCGDARFQFLDPNLIRMEYAVSDKFIDSPSAVVTNRDWHGKRPEAVEEDGWMIVTADKLVLRYKINSGQFTHDNLSITWKFAGDERTWSPGDTDNANLGGIISSLDGANKKTPLQFRPGILSRNGYFLLDDSRSPLWDNSTNWIVPRPNDSQQDLYCILYQSDYRLAFRLFSKLCGNIPMIPRYTLGSWITDLNYEYLPSSDYVVKYHSSDADLKTIVQRFRSEQIPLDIFVLDFAWHKFGWKGGYDWSPIFNDPKEFLNWSHRNGIKISLNDHPGYGNEGVLSDEDSHAASIRSTLDISPSSKASVFIDIARDWKFQIDPKDVGLKAGWMNREFVDSSWNTIQAASLWEEQGFPEYDGLGWYRKWVTIPDNVPQPFYLLLGGVDDEYDLFINGSKITHEGSPGNSVYNMLTSIDVSSKVKHGQKNLIVLRVNDWGGGGGIVANPVAFSDKVPESGIHFNLAEKKQADVFMSDLHNPLIDQGVDFWWIDGGRGSAKMAGLSAQMWTNRVYYDYTEQHTKKRAFVFSRYGGWGNHRFPGLFTGDTYSDWEVLAQEVPYTSQAGNALIPYVTHDIGGFLGRNVSFDLYARWVEFGTFSPFLRLHSAIENPRDGNLRMPWTYGEKGIALAKKYFQLRYHLIPYIYTLTRTAQDSALPIVRPLYLEYPNVEQAYSTPSEYMFGPEILVAPIIDSTGEREIFLPPGNWIDFWNGTAISGNQTVRRKYATVDIPVFVREGAVLPGAPPMAFSDQKPLDTLVIDVYGEGKRIFNLYEDDGVSLAYRSGQYAWTPILHEKAIGGGEQVTINPPKGKYPGYPTERAYIVNFHGIPRPTTARINYEKLSTGNLTYDKETMVTSVFVAKMSTKEPVRVVVK